MVTSIDSAGSRLTTNGSAAWQDIMLGIYGGRGFILIRCCQVDVGTFFTPLWNFEYWVPYKARAPPSTQEPAAASSGLLQWAPVR